MRILVTGNNGYIGSVLIKLLINKGYDVIGLDTSYYKGCEFGRVPKQIRSSHVAKSERDDHVKRGRQTGMESLPVLPKVKQIIKDIREARKGDLKGIDAVIHLAALSNDPLCELNPKITYEINHIASVRLAMMAKQTGVRRFIFASSQGMYGIAKGTLVNEDSPKNPLTAYAKSKLMAEKDIAELADDKFTPVYLRPTTVCGISPMLRCDILLNTMVASAYTSGKITIKVADDVWRAVIHVGDACSAFMAALEAPKELVYNQAFNVGENKNNSTVHNMAKYVKEVMPGVEIELLDDIDPDERNYKVDFRKINKVLKDYFKPKWSIKEAVRELYDSFKREKLTPKEIETKYIRLTRLKHLTSKGKLNANLYWR